MLTGSSLSFLFLLGALLSNCFYVSAASATITIDPTQNRHYISPLIYGMNFATNAQVTQGGVAMSRWGGDSTSSYNYLNDVQNHGLDFFFELIPGCWDGADGYCEPAPSDPKTNSQSNQFLAGVASQGISTFFTIPLIGWVPNVASYAQPLACSFPKSMFPNQDCFDAYDSSCGCGTYTTSGQNYAPVCPNSNYQEPNFPYTRNPSDLNIAADPTFIKNWVSYLVDRFGPSNGKIIYQLDNEPGLWSETHNDLHPTALTYDEQWNRTVQYATAILEADPTALIAGPVEWGWLNYWCSDYDRKHTAFSGCEVTSPDRAAHGGTPLIAWLLQKAAAHEQATGQRILHYLDVHYYPAGGSSPANIQSLWNSSYIDPSYINTNITLLPRLMGWVAENYPGTKTSISEFEFGGANDDTACVTYAELLGFFGAYGLDAATSWEPPTPGDIAFAGYQIFRNYDGKGSQFFPTSIQAVVSGSTGLHAFSSVGSSSLTTVVVNENSAISTQLTFGNFQVSGSTAQWFVNTGTSATITKQTNPTIAGDGSVTITFPANSVSMVVVQGTPGANGGPLSPPPSTTTSSASSGDGGPSDYSSSGGTSSLLDYSLFHKWVW